MFCSSISLKKFFWKTRDCYVFILGELRKHGSAASALISMNASLFDSVGLKSFLTHT